MIDRQTVAVADQRLTVPWAALFLTAIWTWAIWSCAEHWRGNPNYSYGWAVPILGFCFAVRRYLFLPEGRPARFSVDKPVAVASVCLPLALVVFGLEYGRTQMWHPEIVLWTICLVAAALTLALFWWSGGAELARAELFPVLFFLTGVPWPPRLEQPLTSHLMTVVASATTEILHWLGIAAQTSGGAIALHSGLVGITEACSGIRSLQAGTMFGLAMGEWFLLRPNRRVILLGIAIVLALVTNLARTLTLALQAEWHGASSVDQVHDVVGNIVITTLVLAIWLAGRLMSQRPRHGAHFLAGFGNRAQKIFANLFVPRRGIVAGATMAILLGIISARLLYAHAEGEGYTQKTPHFTAQTGSSTRNELAPVPREVWNELRPTTGEYIRHRGSEEAPVAGDCFHFFWKPSVWNRFALVHRPDICMPGIGWQTAAPPESIDVDLNGHPVRFYLFSFRRGTAHALELWGAWRNGGAVPLDYTVRQVFGVDAPPTSLPLQGKRRSATEIVGCSVISENAQPSKEIAVALLKSVFIYKGP